MGHTVTAKFDKNQGLYFYYLDGVEFLRGIDAYLYATIYIRVHPKVSDGESVWVIPTRTNRKATRKGITAAGGEFEGVIKIQF